MTKPKDDIRVKFFALVREQIGTDELTMSYLANETVAALKARLMSQSQSFELALSTPVVMACNQTIVDGEHIVNSGDEVAFFPPVTGG